MAKKNMNILENFLNADYKGDEKKFNKVMLIEIIISLVFLLLGVLLVSEKIINLMFIRIFIGLIALAESCISFVSFKKYRNNRLFVLNIVFSVLYLLSAVLFITNLINFVNYINIYSGMLFIITFIKTAYYGITLFKVKESSALITTATSIIYLALGIIIIINPFNNFDIYQILGIFIILYSLLSISNSNLLRNRVCKFMSKVDNN